MLNIKIKTEDGYTFTRKQEQGKYVWTNGDMIFEENLDNLPIDESGDLLEGVISIEGKNDSDFISSDNDWTHRGYFWETSLGGFFIDEENGLTVVIDNAYFPVAQGTVLEMIQLQRKYMEMLETFSFYDTKLDFIDVVMLPKDSKISLLKSGGHFKKMSSPVDFKEYLCGFKKLENKDLSL